MRVIPNIELYDSAGSGNVMINQGRPEKYGRRMLLLADGNLVEIGAMHGGYLPTSNVWRINSTTLAYTAFTAANFKHWRSDAVLLSNGKILMTGSWNASLLNAVELYDPSVSGSTTTLTSLLTSRMWHKSIKLANEKVLITVVQ